MKWKKRGSECDLHGIQKGFFKPWPFKIQQIRVQLEIRNQGYIAGTP